MTAAKRDRKDQKAGGLRAGMRSVLAALGLRSGSAAAPRPASAEAPSSDAPSAAPEGAKGSAEDWARDKAERRRRAAESLIAELSDLPAPALPPDPRAVKQIAVNCHMAIGNLIMFQPFLRALRRRFPEAELVQVSFEGGPRHSLGVVGGNVDREAVVPAPKAVTPKTLEAMREAVARERLAPDIVVARWIKEKDAKTLCLLGVTRPAYRLGFVSSGGYAGAMDRIFNVPIQMQESQHEVERYLSAGAALGCDTADSKLGLELHPEHLAAARAFCARHGIEALPKVGFQSGSSAIQSWKRWPMEHWIALARRLTDSGVASVFFGSPEERADIEAGLAAAGLADHPKLVVAAGELSFVEAAAVISLCDVMVAPDSSLMHVAAALEVELVALMGPTDFARTRPWTERCTILREACACNTGTLFDSAVQARLAACDDPCMGRIEVETVWQAVWPRLRAGHPELAGAG
jgi:heptosyltransferase-2